MAQISSISSRSQSTPPVKSRANIMSPIDREIEQLINQKGMINEKIASVRSDEKLDSKQKDERIKLLTVDMQLLESQIMQKRMEKTEDTKNKNSASSQKEDSIKKTETNTGKQDLSGIPMEKFLQASNLHDQLTKMASVRRSLKVESDTLRQEVRKGRELLGGENEPGDPGKSEMRMNLELTINKSKTEDALNIERKITELDRKISEKIEDTREDIQNDDKKIVTGEVDNQEDLPVSNQPVHTADRLGQNQDTDKNKNNNLQEQRNMGIDIRV
ncbi:MULTISPECIES: FlxA-like family protein [Paenibacillus]|jgi:hypothetical protein|uniref:FlxA-like family protein n=1 Tax=Paenibacillus TaxID=44249 RepID=UPI0003E20F92|nr:MULTISPECIES: FlxA-like family protein [Paenibacillus]ANA78615.1 hypothetical protein A3958_00770 [Paenibacillus glucanolyticus]ETT34904.1 hypothetical protein C169_17737 [Paenibacillus sp. FSL R5-808]MPY16959.1 hypothetical protein [Paenibacillus glucanolyticus]